jgi:hypothetical protein
MIPLPKFDLITATYPFRCPLCSQKVFKGDACLQSDTGRMVCIGHLPARRLIPIAEYQKKLKNNVSE